jgi:ubiquinone/menaquinone biosynthesis C-methylase UbiE/DNA-binding HxlR family transcriptional regulator
VIAAGDVSALLKALGDETRLRILALLVDSELSVGELSKALDMSQSRVSNHLRLLRDTGLIAERHAGSSTFLRLAPSADQLSGGVWNAVQARVRTAPEHHADRQRLAALLDERERRAAELFEQIAPDWDKFGVDFATGQARQRALASLLPRNWTVADIGCGTGYLARGLLGLASKIVCVDRSQAMLDQARERIAREGAAGVAVDFRRGPLDQLPIATHELDGLVAGMVLHHLSDLGPAFAEFRRVLKPGAPAVVLELEPHGEDWMREHMGDRHLGLDARDVAKGFTNAGFESLSIDTVDDRYTPRRPAAEALPESERAALKLYLVRGFAPGAEND